MATSRHLFPACGKLLGAVIGLALLLTFAADASAQPLQIDRSFFTGWRYTMDGENYLKVGSGARDLREVMGEYRVCVAELNSYQSHVTAAKITGLTSVFLIAFPLVTNSISGDWSKGSTPMILVGVGFGAFSIALEASGSRSLKNAVRLYNRYNARYQAHSPEQTLITPSSGQQLTLRFRF